MGSNAAYYAHQIGLFRHISYVLSLGKFTVYKVILTDPQKEVKLARGSWA